MRIPVLLILAAAAVTLALVIGLGMVALQPPQSLILTAAFSSESITPNADGQNDVAIFSYTLSRNATISITFTAADGTAHNFRENQPRERGDYRVEFSGIVSGFTLPGESLSSEVLTRLLPNGTYTWMLRAQDESGASDERSGTLLIADGDAVLPDITTFTVSPNTFSPNQDGIDDRSQINVYLSKDVQELSVYLLTPTGEPIYISEREEGRQRGEAGRHTFDYEGGVDLGMDPPPDGTYTLVAEAQDTAGQRVRRTTTLTITTGGDPQAEIAPQPIGVDVVFTVMPYEQRFYSTLDRLGDAINPPADSADLTMNAITMPLGDILAFRLTVENYSNVPIRTAGPPPGTVYEQEQLAGALGFYGESGAWVVGIQCDTSTTSYPWRWALGTAETLDSVIGSDGNTYLYLPPGESRQVWGGIRMTELVERRNPQYCWAGLIHEDVEVSVRNMRVGPREIELVDTSVPATAEP
ncbi:MAG: hypothetical protein HXY40_15070 [Chloroflexi bacterium]|nr:hypothetical protein [Chloroflexota bacterium]